MPLPDQRWRAVLLKEPCVWCGRAPREIVVHGKKYSSGSATAMTIEHIIPISLGGARRCWTNEAPACSTCNHARVTDGILTFLLWRQKFYRRGPNWARNRKRKDQRRRAKAAGMQVDIRLDIGVEGGTLFEEGKD